MQIHQLEPKQKVKPRKRVGRGGRKGTYSGRGMKGQKSRSGNNKQPLIRELIKKYPKLRGYRIKSKDKKSQEVNLGLINNNFEVGASVTPRTLLAKDLIGTIEKKGIKILSQGSLTKKLSFKGLTFSKKAEEKIKQSGSKIIE